MLPYDYSIYLGVEQVVGAHVDAGAVHWEHLLRAQRLGPELVHQVLQRYQRLQNESIIALITQIKLLIYWLIN